MMASRRRSPSRDLRRGRSQTLLSINDTGGRKSISCDAFALSKSYLIAEGSEAGIELSAHSPELNELLDAEDAENRLRHSAEGILGVPDATLATWDARSTSTATRTSSRPPSNLNDAASTIVQLSLDADPGR